MFVAVMFLEIGIKIGNARFFRYPAAAFVDESAVLVWAYGKRSREIITSQFLSLSRRHTQTELDAFLTPLTTFGKVFKSLCKGKKRSGVIGFFDDIYIKSKFLYKPFKFIQTEIKFAFG